MAICLFPSINLTPCKAGLPVPYPVWHMMGNSETISTDTHFNEEGVYILNQTVQPTCIGDFLGQGGGVKSGTVSDEIRPTEGSTTIFSHSKNKVYMSDILMAPSQIHKNLMISNPKYIEKEIMQ